MVKMLTVLGISCCECPKSKYKLSPLFSGCKDEFYLQSVKEERGFPQNESFAFEITCGGVNKAYLFELTLAHMENQATRRNF